MNGNAIFPRVLAVAFSCLLIALQCGLLLGLFSITSIPIDGPTPMSGWAIPKCPASTGTPIPEAWLSYVAMPEVKDAEPYMQGFAYWRKADRRQGAVHGHRLPARRPDPLGADQAHRRTSRRPTGEPNAVVVDEGEFTGSASKKVGDTAEINGQAGEFAAPSPA